MSDAVPAHGYCERCAAPMSRAVPPGDNRDRRPCTACGHIAYDNPKNVVGCLLEWQGKVLLCRRGIEPRHGLWTLPAGFMENGESTIDGAAREAFEEATARASDLRLYAVYNLPRISQVYLMFYGTLQDGFAEANEETLEVALFDESEIPWDELAFPVVTETLQRWLERGEARAPSVHHADIASRPGEPMDIRRHPG